MGVRSGSSWAFQVLHVPAQDGQHFIDILEPTIGNYVRSVIKSAPKRIKAAFSMDKGTVVDLPRTSQIGSVTAGLGWDTSRGEVDLDVSAVMFNQQAVHIDTVFFNKLSALGVTHSGDNRSGKGSGDDES